MISVSVDVQKALASLEAIISGLDNAVDKGLEQTAAVGQWQARLRSKGSVRKSIVTQRNGQGFDVSAMAPHAYWVEHGRKGFKAKNAKALRFEVGGRVIFRKSVGPAAPRPFMQPAADIMARSNFVEKSIDELIRGA